MAEGPDHAAYVGCMEEIKKRLVAIDEVLNGTRTTAFRYTNIEFVALQFRKTFELIVLASLASNRHLFNELSARLSKEWEVKKVIAAVKRQNPNFYPKPIRRVPHLDPKIKDEHIDVSDGYLTLPELTEAHGQIGALMHASNPYREQILLDKLEAKFQGWRDRTIKLLDHHQIRFPGDDSFLYVGMHSAERGAVHTSFFTKQTQEGKGA